MIGDILVKVMEIRQQELQVNLTLTRMKPLKREPFHNSFMISMSLSGPGSSLAVSPLVLENIWLGYPPITTTSGKVSVIF